MVDVWNCSKFIIVKACGIWSVWHPGICTWSDFDSFEECRLFVVFGISRQRRYLLTQPQPTRTL